MSSLAIALVAAAAVQAAQPGAPTAYRPVAAAPHEACGPQIDPDFVHFVPPAPSANGNPLFRLISAPDESFVIARLKRQEMRGCLGRLQRVDFTH